jgi:hypothetical protein
MSSASAAENGADVTKMRPTLVKRRRPKMDVGIRPSGFDGNIGTTTAELDVRT